MDKVEKLVAAFNVPVPAVCIQVFDMGCTFGMQ